MTELLRLTPGARTPAILFAYSACNFIIGFLDQRNIRRAGRTTPTLSAFYAWLLPPLYLYKRARLLGQPLYTVWIWIIGAAVTLVGLPGPASDLQVKRYNAWMDGDRASLEVINTGTGPVRINAVSVNDRSDCSPHRLLEAAFSPIELKVGERALLFSSCSIVRVTLRTDKGSETYHFGE